MQCQQAKIWGSGWPCRKLHHLGPLAGVAHTQPDWGTMRLFAFPLQQGPHALYCHARTCLCAPTRTHTTHARRRQPHAACGAQTTTALTYTGGTDVSNLRYHDVSCAAGSALLRFQMVLANFNTKMAFTYVCQAPTTVSTRPSGYGSDYINANTYLDLSLANVACPSAKPALTEWRVYQTGAQVRIVYQCSALSGSSLSCAVRSTALASDGSGTNLALNSHNVQCACCEEGRDAVEAGTRHKRPKFRHIEHASSQLFVRPPARPGTGGAHLLAATIVGVQHAKSAGARSSSPPW